MLSKSSLLFLFCAVTCYGEQLYKGYKIYEVSPKTEGQLNDLGKFSEQHAEFDFLSDTLMINGTARIVTSPSDIGKLETFLWNKSLSFVVVNDDLSQSLVSESPTNGIGNRIPRVLKTSKRISFTKYHRHKDINDYLDKLAKVYPNRVTVKMIGRSFEGRKMKIIRISNGLHDRLHPKKTILIDAGIHAREWIAPAAALFVINQLVENQEANTDLLLGYDWIILPVANPDGYEYSFNKNRLWRKTRSKNNNKKCPGTDPNRNFGYKWGLGSDSKDECSDIYPGRTAFSEEETKHIKQLMLSIKDNCKLYITLHSYGRCILYPWVWNPSEVVNNLGHLHAVAMAGQRAASTLYEKRYLVGSAARVYETASGTSTDWAYAVAKIPVTIAVELPAGGKGFDPPPRDIKNMVNEGWSVIKAMATETKRIFN